MLFDLRAGGRRRLVQVVYLGLALLLGGGLVLFGIGGEVSGGLFDAFREEGSRDNATQQLEQRLEEQQKRLAADPDNAAALAETAKVRYQLAGTGENFNEDQGRFTAAGLAQLRAAERAWTRYLATDPDPVNAGVAIQMVQAFGPSGLNRPNKAVEAMELYIAERPDSAGLFGQLAVLAYTAGQTRKGDLAADQAIRLTDDKDRTELRQQLDAAKAAVAQEQVQQQAQQQLQGGAAQPGG